MIFNCFKLCKSQSVNKFYKTNVADEYISDMYKYTLRYGDVHGI